MLAEPDDTAVAWRRDRAARAALAAFAVDPAGLGGVVLHGRASPARDRWLAELRAALPNVVKMRRVPVTVGDDRLLGGLDLVATLKAGRSVLQHGLLAELDGGVAVFPMAERMPRATAQRIATVLDTGSVQIEREGMSAILPARTGVVLLDESLEPDESAPVALRDRVAFWLECDGDDRGTAAEACTTADEVALARRRLPSVVLDDASLQALTGAAAAFGVPGIRAPLFALRTARALAALDADREVGEDHLRLAAELVFAPRATRLPAPADPTGEDDDRSKEETPAPPSTAAAPEAPGDTPVPADALPDRVIEATRAALPPALLAALASELAARGRQAQSAGRAGELRESLLRGRPLTPRAGLPRGGARLDLLATLRVAAPWQRLRATGAPSRRLRVEVSDLRIKRFRERSTTMTIFVVDASGSTALHRFGEAKGAVQLLLADCYVRRDEVAVVTFRGAGASLAVPPTRSLVRAKRCLDGVAGGGGTPLAAGLRSALEVALIARRRAASATIIVLSDGNANVGLNGIGGRAAAEADSLAIARQIGAAGISTLFIDTAPRPREAAARLATVMRARYLPLPYANAAAMHAAVSRMAAGGAR